MREIKKADQVKNELLKDKVFGDYFIKGDMLDTTWWFGLQGREKLTTGEVRGGYEIQFADGSKLRLSHLQLFSILNDRELQSIDRKRWTLGELNKDTWEGTVRDEEVIKDNFDSKIYYID